MKKIVVVGTGYVGLVSGVCFAELGNDVTCVDIDEQKIAAMQEGKVPIYEPGLEDLFTRNVAAARLHFTSSLADAVSGAEVIFLALPTPSGEDGSADLSYVLGVAENLGQLLKSYAVIVNKSTVPVGTAEKVHACIAKKARIAFDVVSNPEFLREGLALQDFMKPDRVVIGSSSTKAQTIMQELYKPIADDTHPLILMDERSAELTKYAANSFLATKITFMNQIANLCERLGADVDAVRKGVGSDPRIGDRFLYPGIGYGGSCFPKDVWALIRTAHDNGYELDLLEKVLLSNQEQRTVLTKKVLAYYGNNVSGKTFALWGIAFKPDTDDIREAPALHIIDKLLAAGAKICAYDPVAMENLKKYLQNAAGVTYANSAKEALVGSHALLIATEWSEFAEVPLVDIAKSLASPVVFDGRNLYDLQSARAAHTYYESIGRPVIKPA